MIGVYTGLAFSIGISIYCLIKLSKKIEKPKKGKIPIINENESNLTSKEVGNKILIINEKGEEITKKRIV